MQKTWVLEDLMLHIPPSEALCPKRFAELCGHIGGVEYVGADCRQDFILEGEDDAVFEAAETLAAQYGWALNVRLLDRAYAALRQKRATARRVQPGSSVRYPRG